MSRKSRISFGPGAASLILIVVILTMSVLAMLALMNARNDETLSNRSMAVVQAGYALNTEAERAFAELDALAADCARGASDDEAYLAAVSARLGDGMTLIDREICWEERDALRTLSCGATLSPLGENPRLKWTTHMLSSVTEEAGMDFDDAFPAAFPGSFEG